MAKITDHEGARGTVSFTDLPVSQGARDLWERLSDSACGYPGDIEAWELPDVLDVLAAADPRDVKNLLWARRAGKL